MGLWQLIMAAPTRPSPQLIRSIVAMEAFAQLVRNVVAPCVAVPGTSVRHTGAHRTVRSNAATTTVTPVNNVPAPAAVSQLARSIVGTIIVNQGKGVPAATAHACVPQISTAAATIAVLAANAPARAAFHKRPWTAETGHSAGLVKSALETGSGVWQRTAWIAGLTPATPE